MTAVVNSLRKALRKVHEQYPGLVKYLVAEPRYWDLEPPKHFVTEDHYHPLVDSTPSVDYTKPADGVRELDLGPVRGKDGHYYHQRDFRRNTSEKIEVFLSGNVDDLKTDARELYSKMLAAHGLPADNPKHEQLLGELFRVARFRGRPSDNHPINRDNTDEEYNSPDYILTRYHSDEVHEEWERQQFQQLDRNQAATSRLQ